MHDRHGYHVEIGGKPYVFPKRIELLGHGIDELLLELEVFPEQKLFRDGKRWVNDRRAERFAYRYARPHPLILQALAATGVSGESGPFFGDPNWFLEIVRRDDGDLLIASASRILATTWLAFEPRQKEGAR